MDETEISVLKGKLVRGVFALTTRTFILQLIAFISTFILTILLSPSIFGVFFVVSAVISFLSYFSDFGLAAALIQKKDAPTRDELVSAFTIQQILVGALCAVSLLISPQIGKFYGLNADGVILLCALLVSFFLSSLKTIPSVLLERQLRFELLVIPQILETFSFYLVAILLAFFGKGALSFAWAAVIRGIIGLIAIYVVSPWKPGFKISFGAVKHLLNFGIPFQANSLLALVKDDLMTLFLGKILPLSQIGYLGWAKKWAEAPLRLIMDNIIRVTFPAYARLQHDKATLGKAIGKSFFFLGLFMFPISVLLILFINPMIALIPKYSKWEPAILAFYFYTFSSVLASFSSPIVNALNAIGKIKTTLFLMIVWTALTWLLVPYFTVEFGYNGAAGAAALISVTSILPIILMKRIVDFPIAKSLYKPFISAIIMAVFAFLILGVNPNFVVTILSLVGGMVVYLLLTWFWMKEVIYPYLPQFVKSRL